jgi:hypothetical protein
MIIVAIMNKEDIGINIASEMASGTLKTQAGLKRLAFAFGEKEEKSRIVTQQAIFGKTIDEIAAEIVMVRLIELLQVRGERVRVKTAI